MPPKPWTPVCETCHSRPKMDRCDCCEECWYSGRWSRSQMRTAHWSDYGEPLASMIRRGEIEPPDEFVIEDGF